jgi:hypothetical protein
VALFLLFSFAYCRIESSAPESISLRGHVYVYAVAVRREEQLFVFFCSMPFSLFVRDLTEFPINGDSYHYSEIRRENEYFFVALHFTVDHLIVYTRTEVEFHSDRFLTALKL